MSETEQEDKPPSFAAYVMMSDGIQFNTDEILAALQEDYPSLELNAGMGMNMDCDTNQFITSPLFLGGKGDDALMPLLVRLPGYGTWDPTMVPVRQGMQVPDLAERLARNRSYICVSVSAKGHSSVEAFRAARLCSCIAAVFARLPVAELVYWESGDQFLTPEAVVKMADQSASDEWPMLQWIGLAPFQTHDGQAGGLTVGLNHFTGFEVSHGAAPITLGDAGSMLLSAATLAVAYGNKFNDGDTLANEGQSKDQAYRIRHVPKGTEGSPHDVKLLVHPKSDVDHEALAGPILSRPPPPGMDNTIPPNEGFFKRLIRGQMAH